MEITTNTTTVINIQLTEIEARTALAEPEKLQAQLRAVLAPLGKARARASGRKDLVIVPKVAAAPKVAGGKRHYKPRERKPCPKCGKMMTGQGLWKHLPTCHGKASA